MPAILTIVYDYISRVEINIADVAMVSARAFEDLFIGESVTIERTISQTMIQTFAELTGDVSTLHMSDSFAASRGFRSRVAHGALLTGFSSSLFGVLLPGRDCLLQSLSMAYLAPVYAGDRLEFVATVKQTSDVVRTFAAEISVIRRPDGMMVARGKAQVGFTR